MYFSSDEDNSSEEDESSIVEGSSAEEVDELVHAANIAASGNTIVKRNRSTHFIRHPMHKGSFLRRDFSLI
jgi:hypothetical protein